MARETRLLTGADVLAPELSAAWDELPLGRADLADLYDTHTWLSAWSAVAPEDEIGLLRVPVLYDGDRLVAALPLTLRAWGRWESAGIDRRPRWRPVLGWPHPDEEALELLVEEAARRGAREFSLVAMPARDPATEALEPALGQAGFAAVRTGAATECLALVAGGWAGHRARFKKFDRTARNFWNKAERLGIACATEQPQVVVRDTLRGETIQFSRDADLTPTPGHWSNYPLTVARRLARNFPGLARGARIALASDLPPAAGMSSSSALMVAIFFAIADANGLWSHDRFLPELNEPLNLAGYLATIENGQSYGPLAGDRGRRHVRRQRGPHGDLVCPAWIRQPVRLLSRAV